MASSSDAQLNPAASVSAELLPQPLATD
ncbi:hypothetical protein A2U01_0080791, partial [Trifolium medium]|nr:hypothetical protein [Trifolium medium]